MRVLLVNPNRERMPWPAVPVGLCLVATAADAAGHEVAVADLTFSRDLGRPLARAIRRKRPEVIGVSIRNIDNCNFEAPVFYLDEVRDAVVATARRVAPGVPVVIGGAGVNVAPGEVLAHVGADIALVGEGEEAFPRLLAALADGRDPEGLPGVLVAGGAGPAMDDAPDFGHDRRYRGTPPGGRARVDDLDAAPRAEAWRWVDLGRYARNGGPYSIQTKRGCALRCVYCVYNNIEGRRYRLRSAESIADEIEVAVRERGVRHVDFVDSTFNLPLHHARAVCDAIAARRLDVELSTMGMNPAACPPDLLDAMRRAGFRTVMCTPESASDVTLRSLRKGFKREAVVKAARHLRASGLRTFWFFMFGAPGETLATAKETLAFCESEIPDGDMVLFTTGIRVYPGTPLELQCREMGWFAPDDPLVRPSWFVSPEVDLAALYELLKEAALAHPNWMTNAETIISPAMGALMKQGFRLLGWRGPFWQHLPRLLALSARAGSRQRGLAESAARVAAIGDVRHHGG